MSVETKEPTDNANPKKTTRIKQGRRPKIARFRIIGTVVAVLVSSLLNTLETRNHPSPQNLDMSYRRLGSTASKPRKRGVADKKCTDLPESH